MVAPMEGLLALMWGECQGIRFGARGGDPRRGGGPTDQGRDVSEASEIYG